MGPQLSLGIDGGASSAKWSLLNQDFEIVKQGVLSAIDGHLYRDQSRQRFQSFLNSVKKELGELSPNLVTLGITGLGAPEQLLMEINNVFPEAKVDLFSDIALAYRSAFLPGEGIYLYAGTGSVAIHVTKEQQEITVGGWGYLLGDEGAGYWIGRQALRHLLFQIEADEKLDELSTQISKTIGGANWSAVRSFVYGKDRAEIAALAPLVTSAADSNVDSANEILESAAHHLFEVVQRLRTRLNSYELPIAFGGGISETGVSDLLEKKLGAKLQLDRSNHSVTAAKLGLIK